MKTIAAALLVALAACSSPGQYGGKVPAGEAVAATTVLHHPELYDGKRVVVEGRIDEVCPIKGCWMVLRDGDKTMRVTFADYAFFVPKDSAGQVARIDGVVARRVVPVDEARHYLEDAGKHDEAAKITAPVEQLTMVASGVELRETPSY